MFPKYEVVSYSVADRFEWGIHKRFLLFWYKPLIHLKYVLMDKSDRLAPGCPSREILTFRTEKKANNEMVRLELGYPPIESRVYRAGKLLETKYKGGSDGHSQK